MLRSVKHLRAFVSWADQGYFRAFQGLMFPKVSQGLRRSGQPFRGQGIQSLRLVLCQAHLPGQLPIDIHRELDVVVADAGLDQLGVCPRLHVHGDERPAEIMRPDPGEANSLQGRVKVSEPHVAGIERRPILAREHESGGIR